MSRKPWGIGFVTGAITYIVTFVVIAVLTTIEDNPGWQPSAELSEVGVWAWVFYDAHFVGVSINGASDEQAYHILSLVPPDLPTILFYAVPIITLFVGGYLLAKSHSPDFYDIEAPIVSGMFIGVGYLPFAAYGALMSTGTATGLLGATANVGPQAGYAIVFAGLLYPALCGGLGGALAYWVRTR